MIQESWSTILGEVRLRGFCSRTGSLRQAEDALNLQINSLLTLNLIPYILNPKPETLNPRP